MSIIKTRWIIALTALLVVLSFIIPAAIVTGEYFRLKGMLSANGYDSGFSPVWMCSRFFLKGYGQIRNEEEALQAAKDIINRVFHENNEEGYLVIHATAYKTWFVQGILDEDVCGGVPYIILDETNGSVLAVWHTK